MKRLLGGIQKVGAGEKRLVVGDMYLAPASETRARAENAMPGTEALAPILILTLPPIDPELVSGPESDDERDYGPNLTAEYSLCAPAGSTFSTASFAADLTPAVRKEFALPMFYVRTPSGQVTYLQSADAPAEAVELIVGWVLRDEEADIVNRIAIGAERLGRWLAERPEGFASWQVDRAVIAQQYDRARRVMSVAPTEVSVLVWPKDNRTCFDGKAVWRTLHAVGLQWGDGDQFHWNDPTYQTDFLFSALVDDQNFGFALPEEIAAGRQRFFSIRFCFDIARSPHPAHVLEQMLRAAEAAALALDAQLAPCVDGERVASDAGLSLAVKKVIAQLEACDVKPGSHDVCMLR